MNEAVGEVTQNLGFLSVSMSHKVAQRFSNNILFEIRVMSLDKNYQ